MTETSNLPTYITLGKDVNLKYLGKGRYDREWQSGDFVKVVDVDSLHNAIRVKLMTAYGELFNNPTYNQFGNMAWKCIKSNATSPLILIEIKEYYMKALSEMRRILSVDSVNVSADDNDFTQMNVTYIVTTLTDETVTGGVVLS